MVAEPRRRLGRRLWWAAAGLAGLVAVLLEACFGPSAPPAPPAPPSRLSDPAALAPFFAALSALDGKTTTRPLRIMQIGDSHTANDSFSGRVRERLQSRFGAAGRGWLPAGIPFKYYRPQLVEVQESGWQHVKASDRAGVALGLDAVAAENEPGAAEMTIASTEAAGFDRFGAEFIAQPKGPDFTVAVDDRSPVVVSTAAAGGEVKGFELPLDRPAHRVTLRASGQPPVVLLGWDVERRGPGIVYENHGTIGATVALLEQMSRPAVGFEFDRRRPALLVVAFGTNEGFDDGLDLDRYATRFRADVENLQRAAHGVPVLLLGTPDGNRTAPGCTPTPCGVDRDACAWHEPPKLARVRELQRRIAAQQGWASWDWFAAMGGTCSIDRMAGAAPPLAI
ncbi:MAG TPA: GDSL-type esterase/lipase family protein, partial [Stellaceae bacterium]|nr:GDSL-type esterase/lipase family protein [Stellaceae bacterium]